ncbi:unnamed protein product [Rhodiola kirilowii]
MERIWRQMYQAVLLVQQDLTTELRVASQNQIGLSLHCSYTMRECCSVVALALCMTLSIDCKPIHLFREW